jgi:hypothetical protein
MMRIARMNVCLLTRLRPTLRTRRQKSERFRSLPGGSPVSTIDLLPVPRSRNCSGAFEQRASRTKGPLSFPARIEPYRCAPMAGGRATHKHAPRGPVSGGFLRTPRAVSHARFWRHACHPSKVPSMSDSRSSDKLNSLAANFIHKNSFCA